MDGACSTEEETDSEDEEKASSSYDQPLMSHEGFSDTQTLIKEDQTKASAENHYASVAFYVRDVKTGKVYGLTNRHITLHTDKSDIKMLSHSKFIHFGTSVKILDEKSLDIGLIEIDHSVKDLLSNRMFVSILVHLKAFLIKKYLNTNLALNFMKCANVVHQIMELLFLSRNMKSVNQKMDNFSLKVRMVYSL
ncbi:uncharacterized protein LOC128553969 [Mercenaria mercenaria]|uniref:uncharacterized protein LOC128553969 n=1 Tax=Mercenaria mercenaria TaxID=6596 RepID=UPI00234EAD4C|nr:uncharacterized protein LOC128553969 [Mercenaria mercenaria]